MVVQGYVDESGGKGHGPAMVFSAWLGEALQWTTFSDEWQICLDTHPCIQYFKFAEAARCKGQFHGLSVTERDEKVRQLVQIIKRYALTEQFHILDLTAFTESEFSATVKPIRDPYFLPFQFVVIAIAHEVRKRGYTERCEIIFDENVIFGPRAKQWYPILRATMAPAIQPRWTLQIRPLIDTSNPAITAVATETSGVLLRRLLRTQVRLEFGAPAPGPTLEHMGVMQ